MQFFLGIITIQRLQTMFIKGAGPSLDYVYFNQYNKYNLINTKAASKVNLFCGKPQMSLKY